jgi:hypothetical protein
MTINEAKNLCNDEIADRYHAEAREYLKYLLDCPDTKFETKITKTDMGEGRTYEQICNNEMNTVEDIRLNGLGELEKLMGRCDEEAIENESFSDWCTRVFNARYACPKKLSVQTEMQVSWLGPYSWPGFGEINGLPELPPFPGVYLWTVQYLSGYLIYAAGLTHRRFRDRINEHTGKYLAGYYTVLDISDMQLGRRSEVWHGWGWTPAKRAQFAMRKTEIREAANRQLAGFRVFVANVETSGRVLERLEAAIMNQVYHEASPLCDIPDRGMMLAPRWETEEPIAAWNVCGSTLHGLPPSFTI